MSYLFHIQPNHILYVSNYAVRLTLCRDIEQKSARFTPSTKVKFLALRPLLTYLIIQLRNKRIGEIQSWSTHQPQSWSIQEGQSKSGWPLHMPRSRISVRSSHFRSTMNDLLCYHDACGNMVSWNCSFLRNSSTKRSCMTTLKIAQIITLWYTVTCSATYHLLNKCSSGLEQEKYALSGLLLVLSHLIFPSSPQLQERPIDSIPSALYLWGTDKSE